MQTAAGEATMLNEVQLQQLRQLVDEQVRILQTLQQHQQQQQQQRGGGGNDDDDDESLTESEQVLTNRTRQVQAEPPPKMTITPSAFQVNYTIKYKNKCTFHR